MNYEQGYFTFDGVSSKDFGVFINGNKTFNSPQRIVTMQTIPGRNGELVVDEGRYGNMEHSYAAFIFKDFKPNVSGLANYLSTKVGYHRLEDSYHPDEFYHAMFVAGLDVDAGSELDVGVFTLTFNRKPQRFLKSGERVVVFERPNNTSGTISRTIFNPTRQVSAPLIRVYGTGTVGVGNMTIQVTSNPGYIDLDCDMEDAFMESTNCNGNIKMLSDDFPTLQPGNTGIALGSGITKIEITPRWWRL